LPTGKTWVWGMKGGPSILGPPVIVRIKQRKTFSSPVVEGRKGEKEEMGVTKFLLAHGGEK